MSGSASGSSGSGTSSVTSVVRRFLAEYSSGTPSRLKVLDAYLLYVMLTGALQFGYCLGVGTFPFNSFLSGFISAVGSFILGDLYAAPLRRLGAAHNIYRTSRNLSSIKILKIDTQHTYNLQIQSTIIPRPAGKDKFLDSFGRLGEWEKCGLQGAVGSRMVAFLKC